MNLLHIAAVLLVATPSLAEESRAADVFEAACSEAATSKGHGSVTTQGGHALQ